MNTRSSTSATSEHGGRLGWCAGLFQLVASLWAGAQWTVGYLVAPTLFALLDDRREAGRIAGWLFDYKAYGEVDGHLGGDNHSPRKFRSSASDDRSTQIVSMRFSGSRVKDMEISPPVIPDKQHVTVKAGHMRGVVDPMTAMIITSTGKNGALKPSDCNRKIPVFNGRERFDLVLRFKGTSQVSGNRRNTYNGPVIVCQALYRPIAGHRKNREEIDYYVNQKNLEVWLAPAGNTGLLVPVRMVVPTPIGTGVISATGFAASYDGVKHTSATQ